MLLGCLEEESELLSILMDFALEGGRVLGVRHQMGHVVQGDGVITQRRNTSGEAAEIFLDPAEQL